jgi:hypothetical protein
MVRREPVTEPEVLPKAIGGESASLEGLLLGSGAVYYVSTCILTIGCTPHLLQTKKRQLTRASPRAHLAPKDPECYPMNHLMQCLG